jgi:hypothetical protein
VRSLDPALLDAPIEGVNLRAGSLRGEFDRMQLAVFLRHFG